MDIYTAIAANALTTGSRQRRGSPAGDADECRKHQVAGRFRLELHKCAVSNGRRGAADDDTHRFPAPDYQP